MLEGDVDGELGSEAKEFGADGVLGDGVAGDGEFDTDAVGVGGVERGAAGEAIDAIDVEVVSGKQAGDGAEGGGGDGGAEDGDDETLLGLRADPGVIFFGADGGVADVDVKVVGFEEEVGEELGGADVFGEFDEDAEGEGVVDDGLADVEDADSE